MKKITTIILIIALTLASFSGVCYAGDKKYIALSFDDGPGPYTEQLLDILKEKDAHATFFVLGSRLEPYKDTVSRAHREGHQIAIHGFYHLDMKTLRSEAVSGEIQQTKQLLDEILGENDRYLFRPPYGSYDQRVLDAAGVPAICWSIDTRDWEHRNSDRTYAAVIKGASDGAIALQHDIHESSVRAVGRIIDTLRAEGYEFLTVDELFWQKGAELKPFHSYSRCPELTLHTEENSLKLSNGAFVRDIAPSDWYADCAAQMIEEGVMELYDELFYAARAVSRAEVIESLYRFSGASEAAAPTDFSAEAQEKENDKARSKGKFVDVSPSDSFYDAVNWAAAKGISKGVPGGFFRPDEKISRQDFAVLYMRYAEAMELDTAERAPMDGYRDFDKIADYAKDGMAYVVGRHLMGGVGGGLISPRAQLSRAQLAAILSRSR